MFTGEIPRGQHGTYRSWEVLSQASSRNSELRTGPIFVNAAEVQ